MRGLLYGAMLVGLIALTACNLMEIHIITEVGDGINDTVTETTKDSASVSLTK